MRILFLPGSWNSPSARFRIWQFVPPLRARGHAVVVRVISPERTWQSPFKTAALRYPHTWLASLARLTSALWITGDIERFDVVMMNRDLLPAVRTDWLEPWLARRNPRLIFDFDDAIFVGPRAAKLGKILPCFAWVTAGNAYLAEFARPLNPRLSIWPTVVDTGRYRPAPQRLPGPPRIGWSGSSSTLRYCLPLLEGVITRLAQEAEFEFVVIAETPPRLSWHGVKLRYLPWTPETEVSGLQQLDVGLMPLEDKPFERGKCGLKAIQYGGVGVPALVSPVGVNREIVVHGETGFHCADEAEWLENLRRLLADPALRRRLGAQAYARVVERYSVQSLLPEMLRTFNFVSSINI